MKEKMRSKYFPSDFHTSLYHRLIGLRQGSKLILEYTDEFDLLILTDTIPEEEDQCTTDYVLGLYSDIGCDCYADHPVC